MNVIRYYSLNLQNPTLIEDKRHQPKNANSNSELEDLDNVVWESEGKLINEEEDKKDNNQGEAMASLQSSFSFTLEIRFSTAAKNLINADNEVIVEVIREIASNLVTIHFPKLKQWKKLFEHSLTIFNKRNSHFQQVTKDIQKSKVRDVDNTDEDDEVDKNNAESYPKLISLYGEKLTELILVMEECKLILAGKCKDLLK